MRALSEAIARSQVSAQASSGLQSLLRVFGDGGKQLALDDQEGGGPRLTFQAATAGTYFVGVSSAGDTAYNLNAASSDKGGATTGLYVLDVGLTPGTATTMVTTTINLVKGPAKRCNSSPSDEERRPCMGSSGMNAPSCRRSSAPSSQGSNRTKGTCGAIASR